RALLAATIALGPTAFTTSPWCLCTMAAMLLLFAVRHPFGQDGADQLALIIFVGASVATLAGGRVRSVYLWFIALQACLSYATAGFAKATARGWWDGTFLVGVAATRIYGHQGLAGFLARRLAVARALSIFLVFWECTFPLVLVVPRPV